MKAEIFNGIIEVIEPNEEKKWTRIKIDDKWYTAFEKVELPELKKGDFVEGSHLEKENPAKPMFPYLNIIDIKIAKKPSGYRDEGARRERLIVRQVCFKAACDSIKSNTVSYYKDVEHIINLAKEGEKYIFGD